MCTNDKDIADVSANDDDDAVFDVEELVTDDNRSKPTNKGNIRKEKNTKKPKSNSVLCTKDNNISDSLTSPSFALRGNVHRYLPL